ncbi:MAG: hypothetical protein QXH20_02685, partial [Candidatus Bathyarchaeia archaeon]
MWKYFRVCVFVIIMTPLVFSLYGCAERVRRSLETSTPGASIGNWCKVAVLPISDYTSFVPEEATSRRKLVEEAIEDALFSLGFVPVPKEDVWA